MATFGLAQSGVMTAKVQPKAVAGGKRPSATARARGGSPVVEGGGAPAAKS